MAQTKKMSTKIYIDTVRELYQAQAENIKLSGKCKGWDGEFYKYDNIEDYRANILAQITAFINSGFLVKDIDFNDIIDRLENNIKN